MTEIILKPLLNNLLGFSQASDIDENIDEGYEADITGDESGED
jgi:hypothetical protein